MVSGTIRLLLDWSKISSRLDWQEFKARLAKMLSWLVLSMHFSDKTDAEFAYAESAEIFG